METINQIKNAILTADTNIVEGRQLVANKCREFYNIIEEDVFKSGNEWMLNGMYKDLCSGNFAEPFMCERKKHEFEVILNIYENKILKK
jgi:hypothetical protein